MPRLEMSGAKEIKDKLGSLAVGIRQMRNEGAEVGFTRPYTVYVHENLDARHAPGKKAKFLEAPARRLRPELAQIFRRVYNQTRSISLASLACSLRILRAAQEIVPVDTGALKASGYAATKANAKQAADAAAARSQRLYDAVKASRRK